MNEASLILAKSKSGIKEDLQIVFDKNCQNIKMIDKLKQALDSDEISYIFKELPLNCLILCYQNQINVKVELKDRKKKEQLKIIQEKKEKKQQTENSSILRIIEKYKSKGKTQNEQIKNQQKIDQDNPNSSLYDFKLRLLIIYFTKELFESNFNSLDNILSKLKEISSGELSSEIQPNTKFLIIFENIKGQFNANQMSMIFNYTQNLKTQNNLSYENPPQNNIFCSIDGVGFDA